MSSSRRVHPDVESEVFAASDATPQSAVSNKDKTTSVAERNRLKKSRWEAVKTRYRRTITDTQAIAQARRQEEMGLHVPAASFDQKATNDLDNILDKLDAALTETSAEMTDSVEQDDQQLAASSDAATGDDAHSSTNQRTGCPN